MKVASATALSEIRKIEGIRRKGISASVRAMNSFTPWRALFGKVATSTSVPNLTLSG